MDRQICIRLFTPLITGRPCHWVFVPYVFFLTGLPSTSLHLTARQGKGDKANSFKITGYDVAT